MEDFSTKVTWKQFWDLRKEPLLVISIVIGFGAIYGYFQTTSDYWKMVWMALSLGFGVTYYGFLVSDLSKFNNLMIKVKNMEREEAVKHKEFEMLAQNTVESLKSISLTIVNQCNSEKRKLATSEESVLKDIQRIVKSYEKYYTIDFQSDLSNVIRMVGEDEFTRIKKDNYVTWLSPYGVLNAVTGSGTLNSVLLPTNQAIPNQFMGGEPN